MAYERDDAIANAWLEEDGRAAVITESTVHRCCIDDAFTLECVSVRGLVRIRFDGDFTLSRSGDRSCFNADACPSGLGPALRLLFQRIVTIAISDRTLELRFDDATTVAAPPDESQHTWSVAVGRHTLACLPEGHIVATGSDA